MHRSVQQWVSIQELFLLSFRVACILRNKEDQHKDDTELCHRNSEILVPNVLLHMVNNDKNYILHDGIAAEHSHIGKPGSSIIALYFPQVSTIPYDRFSPNNSQTRPIMVQDILVLHNSRESQSEGQNRSPRRPLIFRPSKHQA
jgi:hypothetical protein